MKPEDRKPDIRRRLPGRNHQERTRLILAPHFASAPLFEVSDSNKNTYKYFDNQLVLWSLSCVQGYLVSISNYKIPLTPFSLSYPALFSPRFPVLDRPDFFNVLLQSIPVTSYLPFMSLGRLQSLH